MHLCSLHKLKRGFSSFQVITIVFVNCSTNGEDSKLLLSTLWILCYWLNCSLKISTLVWNVQFRTCHKVCAALTSGNEYRQFWVGTFLVGDCSINVDRNCCTDVDVLPIEHVHINIQIIMYGWGKRSIRYPNTTKSTIVNIDKP